LRYGTSCSAEQSKETCTRSGRREGGSLPRNWNGKMANLGIPHNTIEVLRRHNFTFQKKYGQNFLIDPNVLQRVMDAAGVAEDDCVLEIGPGIGTMTQLLAERAGKVVAVEIDRNLIPILEETLSPYPNVTVINEDILKLDVRELISGQEGCPVKVVANLPYYITTPIIMSLLESGAPLENITVMVQKEVAERMQAGPGTKEYGALSLAVQYYSEPEVVANVPPNCFIPRPNVGSAVIRLTRYGTPPVQAADAGKLFAIIRASFNQRRKTLANSLGNAPGLGVSRERVAQVLEEMGLPAMVRGEALTLTQFAALSDRL
jgi:16S rRNA (adenine1518-N6/adenine1519-N6)-dimethyltransferase